MTWHLLSFGTEHYVAPLKRLGQSAWPWFDEIHLCTEKDLSPVFRQAHKKLLSYERGYGFWIWKPALILQYILALNPGDFLFYCDCQMIIRDSPKPLFDLCAKQEGVLLFHQKREKQINRKWTRRDTFIRMGCDEPDFWDGPQVNTAVSVWGTTTLAASLVTEWYEWCSDFQIISDTPSVLGTEFPEFKDSRQDQSILSIMAIKYGLNTMPDPSQFGVGYEQEGRNYGQVIEFSRMVGRNYPVPCLEPTL